MVKVRGFEGYCNGPLISYGNIGTRQHVTDGVMKIFSLEG